DILNGGAPVTLLHRQGEGEGRTGVLPPGAEEAWLCRGGTTQIPEGKRRVVGPVGPGRGDHERLGDRLDTGSGLEPHSREVAGARIVSGRLPVGIDRVGCHRSAGGG